MTSLIEIDGNVVRHISREVLSEAPLASLETLLVTRVAHGYPILPRNPVRHIYYDPNGGRGYMLIETPPKRHAMRVSHRNGNYPDDEARNLPGMQHGVFNVQLPYMYFGYGFTTRTSEAGVEIPTGFTILNNYLFWRPTALRTLTDNLWPAQCPNVSDTGSICWGTTESDNTSLGSRLDDLVNNFFTTEFNEDLGHITPFNHSMIDWEEDSNNPLGYLRWPMWNDTSPPVYTLDSLKNVLVGREGALPPVINMAELNPSFLDIPELPGNFTIARAQQWMQSLNPATQRRLQEALRLTPAPPEAPATPRRARATATPT